MHAPDAAGREQRLQPVQGGQQGVAVPAWNPGHQRRGGREQVAGEQLGARAPADMVGAVAGRAKGRQDLPAAQRQDQIRFRGGAGTRFHDPLPPAGGTERRQGPVRQFGQGGGAVPRAQGVPAERVHGDLAGPAGGQRPELRQAGDMVDVDMRLDEADRAGRIGLEPADFLQVAAEQVRLAAGIHHDKAIGPLQQDGVAGEQARPDGLAADPDGAGFAHG